MNSSQFDIRATMVQAFYPARQKALRGGWKLAISDTREVAISSTCDVIIPTAIEAHSERSTRFTQTAFVCLGRNSLSGYCQVSSRSTAIALPYTRKHLSVSLGIPTENSAHHEIP